MKEINLIIQGIIWFSLAHILSFYQLNGQFLYKWFRDNEFWVAAAGIFLSYTYIYGTRDTVAGFEGLLWPARFVGFGVGMIIYALLVQYHFNENLTPKTILSLILSVILISIQALWK